MNHPVYITKGNGAKELFAKEKLVSSLQRSGATEETIEDIVENIIKEMHEGMTTTDIYRRAFSLLKQHKPIVAVKYSIRRALLDLGPDGFPFEKFVARIFAMWGYETVTDQMVMGACVPHEIDVVAWKGETLAMVEAKFHNEAVLKSDLKVTLYVKARYDDLTGIVYDYGGTKRELRERWLITNTKFTDRAITYGSCKDLKLIGWNYPPHSSLHEIIEENNMHPITCISSLTNQQKKDLISKDILVCVDLIKQPSLLKDIGIKEDDISGIINEASTIVEMAG